jgi:hypothetical protein
MPKPPRDTNQLGKFIVDVATGNALGLIRFGGQFI